ncbi:hypothetical protein Golax_018479 [Gossypium laxum]|uniref:Uncharacterized protein n=1 Tax=Gossypium laxum TaxID=34288 RepID=A0A7J8Z3E0_9ROSI|nr:hypothetical protein [Gossypium laxum]
MSNLQTSVSTDLTDKDNCVDGFSSRAMNGSVIDFLEKIVMARKALCFMDLCSIWDLYGF